MDRDGFFVNGVFRPHGAHVILSQIIPGQETMARKPSDTVQLKLRFPEALRRRLEREARRHGQSLNREILSILEERFRESDDADRHAAAFAEALRDEFMRLYREDKTSWQAAGANEPPVPPLGPPIRKHYVIPLDEPIPETPEPKIPLPEKEPKPVPLREKEPQFSISSSWTATPSLKTEDDEALREEFMGLLHGPIPETPEPKIPLPEKEPKPVPLREKEPQFSISGSWTATPLPKTEGAGEKK